LVLVFPSHVLPLVPFQISCGLFAPYACKVIIESFIEIASTESKFGIVGGILMEQRDIRYPTMHAQHTRWSSGWNDVHANLSCRDSMTVPLIFDGFGKTRVDLIHILFAIPWSICSITNLRKELPRLYELAVVNLLVRVLSVGFSIDFIFGYLVRKHVHVNRIVVPIP